MAAVCLLCPTETIHKMADVATFSKQWLMTHRKVFKRWLPLTLSAATLVGLAGSAIGLLQIIAYLISVGAPFPLADASATFVLLITAAISCFGVVMIGGMILLPGWLFSVSPRLRRQLRCRPLRWDLPKRKRLEALGNQYLLFQSAPIALICTRAGGSAAKLPSDIFWIFVGVALILALSASTVTFYTNKYFVQRVKPHFGRRIGRVRLVLVLKLLGGMVARTVVTFLWFALIMQLVSLFPEIHRFEAAPLGGAAVYLGAGVLMGSTYCALTSVIARIERIPAIMLFWTVVFSLWWPAFAGRTALRIIGIGGGIPTEIIVKTMSVGSTSFVAEKRIGCLILNAGGQVIMRRNTHPTVESLVATLCIRMPATSRCRFRM